MNENWGYAVLKPPYAVKMGHVIGLNGIIMGNNHHYGEIYIYIVSGPLSVTAFTS